MNHALATLFYLFKLKQGYESALQGEKAPHTPFPAATMRLLMAADAANHRESVPRVHEDTVNADSKLEEFPKLIALLRAEPNLPPEGSVRTQVLTKIGAHFTLVDFEIHHDGNMTAMVLDPGNDTRAAFILLTLQAAKVPTTMVAGNSATLETLQTDSSSCGLLANALAKTSMNFPNFHALNAKHIDGHATTGWEELPLDFSRHAQRSIATLSTFADNHPPTVGMQAAAFKAALHSEAITVNRKDKTMTTHANTALYREEFTQVENSLIHFIHAHTPEQLAVIAENRDRPAAVAANNNQYKERFMQSQQATQDPTRFSKMSDEKKAAFCQRLADICQGESKETEIAEARHQELEILFKTVNPESDDFSEDAAEFAHYLTDHGFEDYSAIVSEYAEDQLNDPVYQLEKALEGLMASQNEIDLTELQDYLRDNIPSLAETMEEYFNQASEHQMQAR